MYRKKLLLILAMLQIMLSANAQKMREVWRQIPNTVVPYLSESNRAELADYVAMGVQSGVKNALNDTTTIEILTDDYMLAHLNATTHLEMKLLKHRNGESLICMVITYFGPAAESTLSFYSLNWEKIDRPLMRPIVRERLMQKTGDMTDEQFEDAKRWLEPALIQMHLSPTDYSLVVGYSLPTLPPSDEELVKQTLVQTKLNWNGEKFY